MRIRIEGTDLPGLHCGPSPDRPDGHRNVYVGVQRRAHPAELLDLTAGDAKAAVWNLDCIVTSGQDGYDLRGPYIQGPRGGRFIYLSWGTVDDHAAFTMFRRAKLWLEAVDPAVIEAAVNQGVLVGRLGLTDAHGHPLCASVRPPVIEWRAART
jgi:hypothetical protein